MLKVLIIVAIILGIAYYALNNYAIKKIPIDGVYCTTHFRSNNASANAKTYILFAKGKLFRLTEETNKNVYYEVLGSYQHLENARYKANFVTTGQSKNFTYKVLFIRWDAVESDFFEGFRVIEPSKQKFLRKKVEHLIPENND
ncbi:MAG: hypothetical protein ACRC37_00720 [Lentisphaeria bacterium]